VRRWIASIRDLFDVKRLLDREGITDEVRLGVIAAMVSHGRPVSELIAPRRREQQETFRSQFEGMPFEPFSYEDHKATLDRLVDGLRVALTDSDRAFLLSFEQGEPDWALCPVATLAGLPAPQFKLANIHKYREVRPERFNATVSALQRALSN
jgi:antitoxin (DNA-binding transcriptional repressor) of toxin-antitoxin stability system